MYTAISLFSGIGAIDLAFALADFAASVREEPFADVAGTADGGDVDDANLYGYTPTNEYAVVRSSIGAGYVTSDVAQPRMGRAADGLPGGLDGHRFPAGPGPQHPWEPPRQIVSRGPHWKHRIKALGNSVVPQCVYPFALEIRNMLEGG